MLLFFVCIALMMLPFSMTAVGPVAAKVIDSAKDPVARACVVEVWQDYSTFELSKTGKPRLDSLRLAFSVPPFSTFSVLRTDSLGVARFPERSASANAFRRLGSASPRFLAKLFGNAPRPTAFLTVLGPGYQAEALGLQPVDGFVTIPIHVDVQSPALMDRFSRSCIP